MTMTELKTKVKVVPAKQEDKLAQALYHAYQERQPLEMTEWEKVVSDDQTAYAVQDQLMELKNQPLGGYKVSLTSQETQDMFDSNEPLYGAQVQNHFVQSPANLSLKSDLLDPLAEVELVFKAKEDLQVTDSLEDLRRKTTVAAGVEVPDARFTDWFPSLSKYLVMADAAVGGFVVYGPERESTSLTVAEFEDVKAYLAHNGEVVAEGSSAEVLGNPLKSLQWLVKKLVAQGKTLHAGERVSSGTFLLPPHLTEGTWTASFNHDFADVVVAVSK
ncbi:2-keto-4-pentenoate hydratase [Fructobacillus cardui]|uniref:2-keto-4-pentenoate hydratase n=1 Tax=Fructobacillus cardui TaxID=2893170 RepID=UPI003D32BE73